MKNKQKIAENCRKLKNVVKTLKANAKYRKLQQIVEIHFKSIRSKQKIVKICRKLQVKSIKNKENIEIIAANFKKNISKALKTNRKLQKIAEIFSKIF